jgi:hypothetical protein
MTDRPALIVQDYAETLNGWDEQAISARFRAPIDELNPTTAVRALEFVLRRRDGAKDADAYAAAMGATQAELRAVWHPRDDDQDQDQEDEQGKAASSGSGPT